MKVALSLHKLQLSGLPPQFTIICNNIITTANRLYQAIVVIINKTFSISIKTTNVYVAKSATDNIKIVSQQHLLWVMVDTHHGWILDCLLVFLIILCLLQRFHAGLHFLSIKPSVPKFNEKTIFYRRHLFIKNQDEILIP